MKVKVKNGSKIRGLVTLASLAALASASVTACSHAAPAVSQCAVVTGHGFGSNTQNVVGIARPGDYLQIGNGDVAWYYPCNARNFIISPPGQQGDVHVPISVRTNAHGNQPGMPVNVWLAAYFSPNENSGAMKAFISFCLKYGCATSSQQLDNRIETDAHSSTPGWENMFTENFPFALQRAATAVIKQFGPDLWTDTSQWVQLGDDIAAQLNSQLDVETESSIPFFCGSGSTEATCTQISVQVSSVVPSDPEVEQLYNQQIAAEQAAAVNTARLHAAQNLYGPYAQYFLGLDDLAGQCKTCTIYVGAPGSVPQGPVPAPAPAATVTVTASPKK